MTRKERILPRGVRPGWVLIRLLGFLPGERRWFVDEGFDFTVDLLLVANPLRRAGQRGADFIDAPGKRGGIACEQRLLADQFHLLLDAVELGLEEADLGPAFLLHARALVQDIELAGQA